MPLDGTELKPSLQMLSTVLRDRSLWPKDFEWNYAHCTCCAMGLLYRLMNKEMPDGFELENQIKEILNIDYRGLSMFIGTYHYRISPTLVTPGDVADEIDAYIAKTA